MALLKEKTLVFEGKDLVIGEFDPSVEGFYKNVMTYNFNVRKRRTLTITISSDVPVDVAVANEKGSSIVHKQSIKDGTVGPISTEDNREMGLFIGVYPGDKAIVNVEAWMEK